MSKETGGPTAPQASVVARNKAVLGELPFANRDDFADAERGFIATLPDAHILNASGKSAAWSQTQYAFIDDGPAPDSVTDLTGLAGTPRCCCCGAARWRTFCVRCTR